jgi:hypothetical protein
MASTTLCTITVVRAGADDRRASRLRAKPTLSVAALARQYAKLKADGGAVRLEHADGRALDGATAVGSLDGALLRAVVDAESPAVVVDGRYVVAGLTGRPELNGMTAVVARVAGDRCVCRCPGVAARVRVVAPRRTQNMARRSPRSSRSGARTSRRARSPCGRSLGRAWASSRRGPSGGASGS